MNKKNKIFNFLEYIVAISIILDCNSIWLNKNKTLINLNYTLLCISVFILIIISVKEIFKTKKKTIIIIIILSGINIYNLIFILLNTPNAALNFTSKFIILFSIFFLYLSNMNSPTSLLMKISYSMIVLSVISLVMYVFGTCLKIINPSSQIVLNWGGYNYISSYYGIYFEAQPVTINGIKLIRNIGIFTEAPMYSFNLCIALLVQLFVKKDINKINICILLVSIFSTLSTTGIIIMSGLLIIKLLIKKSNNFINLTLKMLIAPIILVTLICTSLYFINDKINSSAATFGSYSARTEDFKVGFKAWSKHKIIGNGYDNYKFVQQYMSLNERGNDIGGSSGLMSVLPECGLYLMIFYLIPLILALSYSIKNKELNILIIALTVAVLFTVTNIPYNNIIICFLAYGWTFILKQKQEEL